MFFKKKINYIKVKILIEKFELSSQKIHKILESLIWIKKSDTKGWVATKTGIRKGAKQSKYMGAEYVMWEEDILEDYELKNAIRQFKNDEEIKKKRNKISKKTNDIHSKINNTKKDIKPKRMSDKEKKEKGDLYEAYISKYFKDLGYTIAEHGKDNGVKDNGIDLIAKKGKEIYFIQCKNWSLSNGKKIKDKDLKATQTDARDYLKKNILYINLGYVMKILYVCSENIYHPSATYYARENKDIYKLKVIAIK